MKIKAFFLGLAALASLAESSSGQGKGAGATTKPDSVTGVFVVLLDPGGSPVPRVTWNSIDKATFQVQRSKVGDTCCNAASPAGLTANFWQDSPLPSSGTYIYRVIATLRSGQVVGQTQLSYTAPMRSGRYRVTIRAIQVDRPTIDDASGADGVGDEIYAAAVVVRADRSGTKIGATVVKSKEYGDIGNGSTWPNRVRAGTASPSGGLAAGNRLGDSGTPGAETFPIAVWEGQLADGGEAVVIFPSIWERDTDDARWQSYSANWVSNSAPILNSPLLLNQYSSTVLTPVVATIETGAVGDITAPIYGAFNTPFADWLGSPVDRMIGIMPANGTFAYPEHIVVVTREKLAGLAVGGTADLQIPLSEIIPPGGSYTMILRVERIG